MKIGEGFSDNSRMAKNIKSNQELPTLVNEPRQVNELRAYHQPIISFRGSGKEFDKLPAELKEIIDSIEVDFGIPSGPYGFDEEHFHGTVKDYIEACFSDEAKERHEETTLHATSKNNAYSILKEGFDINRCSRSLGGPGIYFARDAIRIKQVGNGEEVLQANVRGICRSINPNYYKGIDNNNELKEKVKAAIVQSGRDVAVDKAIDKYVLQVLKDDFGLDMIHSRDLVVVNPKCISGVTRSAVSDMRLVGSGYDAFLTAPSTPSPSSNRHGTENTKPKSQNTHTRDDIKYWNY